LRAAAQDARRPSAGPASQTSPTSIKTIQILLFLAARQ
jgi:hypothetical protein